MANITEGKVTIRDTEVPFKVWRRDRSASSAITVMLPEGIDAGEAINQVILQNIDVIDLHASQVFVKIADVTNIAHLRPRRQDQHAALYVIDVENVELEPFA